MFAPFSGVLLCEVTVSCHLLEIACFVCEIALDEGLQGALLHYETVIVAVVVSPPTMVLLQYRVFTRFEVRVAAIEVILQRLLMNLQLADLRLGVFKYLLTIAQHSTVGSARGFHSECYQSLFWKRRLLGNVASHLPGLLLAALPIGS